ncbi:hypothetical protein [Allopontixanthobacter sp.]|uniref:hypothetical protein n=1 Tax=Allopontixanthobacter sp. TaxID=2906452 RepID=UPI002ABA5787|nr:hypothetical protein [Allopontixanthobacter sp.]MDZ4308891.1 hypothetical protein [Allopontixanthobacter sp.]
MRSPIRPSRGIRILIYAALLSSCSGQATDCESFVVENVWFAELKERFPTKIGTNLEARNWIDSSRFNTSCLYRERPEFENGMDYFETREALDGKKVFLFNPVGVTDTLIGFVGDQGDAHVLVVGML